MPGPFHTLDVICARRQALIYVSSPVCEVDFSSSGEPVIVLNPFRRRRGPTGFRLIVVNGKIRFRWDTSDGVICYSLYRSEGGEYVLVAECIPCEACDPPEAGACCYECEDCPTGCYVVTAITEDGETEPSEEICLNAFPTCSVTITTDSPLPSGDFNAPYSQQLDQEFGLESTEQWSIIAGALPAGLTLSPSGLISGTPTDGGNFTFTARVFAMCDDISAGENSKEFLLNIAGGPEPTCIYRIASYGVLQPLFIPDPAAPNSPHPEWDGTFNFIVTFPLTDVYFYKGSNGQHVFPNASIQGKEIITVNIQGPLAPTGSIPFIHWQLQLNDPGATGYLVWFGQKIGGATGTGAGLYTLSGGLGATSDLRPTVLVELCP